MIRDVAYLLWKRQGGSLGQDSDGDLGDYGYDSDESAYYDSQSWWWSPAGMAVRYAIVALLFATILLFFVGGYWHARRRLRKGLPPLPYHRWMVQRRYRPYNPEQRWHTYQQPGQMYQMESYPVPPPAYNPAEAPPPVYQPPQGGSKVMADQSYVHVRPVERGPEPPLPPPPATTSTAAGRQ